MLTINKTGIITLSVLLFLLILAGALVYKVYTTPRDGHNSDAQKTFSNAGEDFIDVEGNPVAFDTHVGKVRVVSSWASWCPQCGQSLQDLNALSVLFKEDDVVVAAINRKESKEQAQRYLKTLPSLDSLILVIDQDDSFYELSEGYAMPETIIYDAKGNTYLHKRGTMTFEEIKMAIEGALASKR
jgi:thiol-disulfide isomerase/thioredoxin